MSIVLQTSETSHFFAPFFPSYLRGQGCLQGRARCLGLRARCLDGQLTVTLLRMKSPSVPFAAPRHIGKAIPKGETELAKKPNRKEMTWTYIV